MKKRIFQIQWALSLTTGTSPSPADNLIINESCWGPMYVTICPSNFPGGEALIIIRNVIKLLNVHISTINSKICQFWFDSSIKEWIEISWSHSWKQKIYGISHMTSIKQRGEKGEFIMAACWAVGALKFAFPGLSDQMNQTSYSFCRVLWHRREKLVALESFAAPPAPSCLCLICFSPVCLLLPFPLLLIS